MMKRFPRASVVPALALLPLLWGCSGMPAAVNDGTAAAALPVEPSLEEPPVSPRVRQALERSLPFLYAEGRAWMDGRVSVQDGSACVSCHHVGYAVWSHAEARWSGVDREPEALEALDAEAGEFLARPSIPRALSVGPYLLAHHAPDAGLIDELLELQTDAGGWEAKGQYPTQRRSVAESNAVATLYAIEAITRAERAGVATDSQAAQWREARERGLGWLASAEPGESVEWLAAKLAFEAFGRSESEAAARVAELLARQRDDGGWGWLADDESDAFSTGQAIYALALAGQADSAAISRGADFLVSTQGEDGTWRVPSRAISHEPSADKDLIYHYWGTAWAALGLARSLEGPEAGTEPLRTASLGES